METTLLRWFTTALAALSISVCMLTKTNDPKFGLPPPPKPAFSNPAHGNEHERNDKTDIIHGSLLHIDEKIRKDALNQKGGKSWLLHFYHGRI